MPRYFHVLLFIAFETPKPISRVIRRINAREKNKAHKFTSLNRAVKITSNEGTPNASKDDNPNNIEINTITKVNI